MPQATGIAGVGHTKKGLSTITVSFNEALGSGSADTVSLYSVHAGVNKKWKTVYSKNLALKGSSYDDAARTVTIALARPFKGAVQVTVNSGIVAANGASSSGTFSAVVK